VGGDRDGQRLVTANVTRQTLTICALHGLLLLQRQLVALGRTSEPVQVLEPTATALRDAYIRLLEEPGGTVSSRVDQEPEGQWGVVG